MNRSNDEWNRSINLARARSWGLLAVLLAGIAWSVLPALAATVVEGSDGTTDNAGAIDMDPTTWKAKCSQSARGAVVNLPGSGNPDGGVPFNNCATVTTVANDYCTTPGVPGIACKQPDAGTIDPDDLPPTITSGTGSTEYYALWTAPHTLGYGSARRETNVELRLDLATIGAFHYGLLMQGREVSQGVAQVLVNRATEFGSYTAAKWIGGPYDGSFPALAVEKFAPLERGIGRITNQGGPLGLGHYADNGTYSQQMTLIPGGAVGVWNQEPRSAFALDVSGLVAAKNLLYAGPNVVLAGVTATTTTTATASYTGRFTSTITGTGTSTTSNSSTGTWTATTTSTGSWTQTASWLAYANQTGGATMTGTSSATGTASGTATVTGEGTAVRTDTVTWTGSGTFTASVTRTLTQTSTTTGTVTNGGAVYVLEGAPVTVSLTGVNTNTAANLSGTLTATYVPYATGATTLANSGIYANATQAALGTTTLRVPWEIVGNGASFIMRSETAAGYTSQRWYNDQNSAFRALEMGYMGSTASVWGGMLAGDGEMGYITTTGAYALALGTSNTIQAVLKGSKFGVGGRAHNPSSYLTVSTNTQNPGTMIGLHSRCDAAAGNWMGIRFGLDDDSYNNQYGKGGIMYECRDGYAVGKLHFGINQVHDTSNVGLANAILTVDGTYGAGLKVGVMNASPGYTLTVGTAGTANTGIAIAGSTSNYSILKAPAAAGNLTWTLPGATASGANKWLYDTGSGVLSEGVPTAADVGAQACTGTCSNGNVAGFNATGTTNAPATYSGNDVRVTGGLRVAGQNASAAASTAALDFSSARGRLITYGSDNSTEAGFNIVTASANGSAYHSWVWPTAYGSSGNVMKGDGSGNLSMGTLSATDVGAVPSSEYRIKYVPTGNLTSDFSTATGAGYALVVAADATASGSALVQGSVSGHGSNALNYCHVIVTINGSRSGVKGGTSVGVVPFNDGRWTASVSAVIDSLSAGDDVELRIASGSAGTCYVNPSSDPDGESATVIVYIRTNN